MFIIILVSVNTEVYFTFSSLIRISARISLQAICLCNPIAERNVTPVKRPILETQSLLYLQRDGEIANLGYAMKQYRNYHLLHSCET